MPRYSEDVIQEVFSANDIVDYISQYVRLQKRGRDYSGLCPFHHEKSPSFHVSQDKQLFHCFGCGASGNLVQFAMKMENLDFVEALKVLAARANIILPEENDGYDKKRSEQRQRIYQMNKLAARFYYDKLTRSVDGREALKYFYDRGITAKTITSYGLGYAPAGYDVMINYMREQGYSDEQIVEAGLAGQTENGRMYDRFRDRVIFPIIDLRGNVIGFGGRVMGSKTDKNGNKVAKYLNSAQTPVYDKGKNLFSLNLAKNTKEQKIILCEGYMDVISTYQAGVKNIVATLGTALTENQAKLLMRYCSEIIICYDSDEAGQKAALRAINIINDIGGKSRVMKLRGAKDPDEFIKANGVEAFRMAVERALPSTEYKLSLVKGKYDISNTEGKVKFVGEAAQALVGVKDAVEVDAYIQNISDETEVSKDAIYSEYRKKVAQQKMLDNTRPQIREPQRMSADMPSASIGYNSAMIEAERRLLYLISIEKKLYKTVSGQFTAQDFSGDVNKKVAEIIYKSWEEGVVPEKSLILNEFSGNDINEVGKIFYNMEIYEDNSAAVIELMKKIKVIRIDEQIASATDARHIVELMKEKAELMA